jgi:hypothetical protein
MTTSPNPMFHYEGRFYARPAYRGISLDDATDPLIDDLDDIVYDLVRAQYSREGAASGRLKITIEITSLDTSSTSPAVVTRRTDAGLRSSPQH